MTEESDQLRWAKRYICSLDSQTMREMRFPTFPPWALEVEHDDQVVAWHVMTVERTTEGLYRLYGITEDERQQMVGGV